MSGGERFKFWSAAFLVLERDGKILLQQRKNSGHKDGEYQFVAGHIEEGETPRDAIAREAKEEAGIHIDPGALNIVHIQLRHDADRTYYDVYLHCDTWEGEPAIMEPEKCGDMQWFSKRDLPPNTIDYIRDVIGHLEKHDSYSEWGF